MNKMEVLHAALRFVHILAGITWIGLLYFFNFVNGPFAKTMDAETKKKVVPELMPRALWWFRMAAMVTFVAGLALFWQLYMHDGLLYDVNHRMSARAMMVMTGMLLGTVMWFNVWFVIWPAQRQLIGWLRAGEKNPAAEALTRRAFLASRANTYLSGPMLVGMVFGSHFADLGYPVFAGALIVSLGIQHLLIGQSAQVSTAV